MSMNLILLLVAVVVGILIIGYLVKSLLKLAIIVVIIYVLFHIGFLWNGQDLINKLHLDAFLKPSVSQTIVQDYNAFSEKRDATGVVQTQAISDAVNSAINETLSQYGKIDKKALLQKLDTKLQGFNASSVNTTLQNLSSQLAKYGITPEDIENTLKSSN